jgi:hypothetical protein
MVGSDPFYRISQVNMDYFSKVPCSGGGGASSYKTAMLAVVQLCSMIG